MASSTCVLRSSLAPPTARQPQTRRRAERGTVVVVAAPAAAAAASAADGEEEGEGKVNDDEDEEEEPLPQTIAVFGSSSSIGRVLVGNLARKFGGENVYIHDGKGGEGPRMGTVGMPLF